jgi:small-conductance mechanosensitive channel
MERRRIRADMALLTERVVYAGLLGLGVFEFISLSLGNAAAGLTGLLVAAFVTSLGLQDIFKSYVAGFYVLLERNVRVGDLIETGGVSGVVSEVRMRTTYLSAEDGSRIVIPNISLFGGTITVREAPPGWGRLKAAQNAKDSEPPEAAAAPPANGAEEARIAAP